MVGVVPVTAGADEAPVQCVGSVNDPGVAVDVAAACGTEVEVVAARTEWDTVYATPEGGTRVETSAAAVRTRVNGGWEPIDTTLAAGASGITAKASALPMTFSDGTAGTPLATIERDGHTLEFHAPFDLTAPVVVGSRVTYADVLPGVDLIATVDEDGSGFSEVLRVNSPEAAANPALAELDFPVTVSDGLTVSESDGGFVAADAGGQEVFSSPTPLMWDAGSSATAPEAVQSRAALLAGDDGSDGADGAVGVDPLTGEPLGEPVLAPALDSAVAAMPVEVSGAGEGDGNGAGNVVTVTPDAAMIADPGTSWPVYIDPGVSGSRTEWTAIRSGMSSDYKFSGDQGLGFCDVSAQSSCGRDFKSRLVWEFRDLSTVSGLASGDITSATFTANGTHSYSCTSYAVQAYNVENIASGTTWSSNSGWTDANYQSTRSVAHRSGCDSDHSPRPIKWNVKQAAQEAASANHSYITIGLKAADETTMSKWKRYKYNATLSVSYNREPAKPTSLDVVPAGGSAVACGSSAWMRDATPTLRAKITDPDGDRLYHNFNVYTSGGTLVYNGPWSTSSYANGTKVTRTVPSADALKSGAYEFRVQAKDTGGACWTLCGVQVQRGRDATEHADGEPGVGAASGVQDGYRDRWHRSDRQVRDREQRVVGRDALPVLVGRLVGDHDEACGFVGDGHLGSADCGAAHVACEGDRPGGERQWCEVVCDRCGRACRDRGVGARGGCGDVGRRLPRQAEPRAEQRRDVDTGSVHEPAARGGRARVP